MPGIPTEYLAEQIQETNRRLVESNERLADEIHTLGGTVGTLGGRIDALGGRVEVTRELGAVRAEIGKKLGTINVTLERMERRLNHAVSETKWLTSILTPVILGLIGTAFWLTWHAAKLDSRVEWLESRQAQAPRAGQAERR
jgi:hypothetical protein